MELTLPISKKKAVLKDYMPHGVFAKFQEAMLEGVEIGNQSFGVSKAQLIDEFGGDVVAKLDELPEKEYQKEFEKLKADYLQRKMEMKGMKLGNIEEANIIKVVGMVESLDGKNSDRNAINDLPQKDYELLLSKIEEIDSGENLSEPSGAA